MEVIKIVITTEGTVDGFDAAKQNQFKEVIATSAGVDVNLVKITSITPSDSRRLHRRMLLTSKIKVSMEVSVPEGVETNSIANGLKQDNLNKEMKKAGLQDVTATVPVVESGGTKNTKGHPLCPGPNWEYTIVQAASDALDNKEFSLEHFSSLESFYTHYERERWDDITPTFHSCTKLFNQVVARMMEDEKNNAATTLAYTVDIRILTFGVFALLFIFNLN